MTLWILANQLLSNQKLILELQYLQSLNMLQLYKQAVNQVVERKERFVQDLLQEHLILNSKS